MSETEDPILTDAVVNPGNSGGPVYDADTGTVVGICDAYENAPVLTNKRNPVQVSPGEILEANAGLAVVVPIKYAIDLVKKNNVSDFDDIAATKKEKGPTETLTPHRNRPSTN